MMMSDDKVGGWVKGGQNHDDVILECPLTISMWYLKIGSAGNDTNVTETYELSRPIHITLYNLHLPKLMYVLSR